MSISIKKLILHKLKMRMKHPFQTSFGILQDKEFFIIEVIDQDGIHGYGESVAFTAPWYTEETVQTTEHILVDFLIPMLQASPIHHPNELFTLFQPIKRNFMAKAALEGAIWDLYAKQKQMPLSRVLGGTKKEIDVGVSIGMQPTIEALLKKINSYIQEGYKRVKLKIKPGHDIQIIHEVRKEFPNLPIMADANSSYTMDDIELLQQLDDYNLMMIEQPLAQDDIVDHAKLQKQINTPICLDESITSFHDARKAIELGSCQIINLKIGRVGGLFEAKRIHDFCVKKGVSIWCGGMLEAGVGRAHSIALSTLTGFNMPGDTASSSNYWEKDIISPEVQVREGSIQVPESPGIGYEIDRNAMEQYTIGKEIFSFE